MSTAAAVAGLTVGSMAAWYETTVLLGAPPAARMVLGIGLGALFLAFAVALTAFVAGLVKGTVATVGVTLGILIGLAIVGGLGVLGRWLPTSGGRDVGPGRRGRPGRLRAGGDRQRARYRGRARRRHGAACPPRALRTATRSAMTKCRVT
jgi:hypothetical protein